MMAGLSTFLVLFGLGAGLVAGTWIISLQLVTAANRPAEHTWFRSWLVKGGVVPWLLWCFINLGLTWWLPPYMPSVALAVATGKPPWFLPFMEAAGLGSIIIASYWSAVTLAWVIVRTSQRLEGENLKMFNGLCLTVSAALILVVGAVWLLGGWLWAGFGALIMLVPIVMYAPGVLDQPKRVPIYARAIAKIKFGKYADAEQEVLSQLEKAEDDFQGWLMLATLYAEHFGDLREAEQTILELCDHPATNASQAAIALNKLADWHLNLGKNPSGARGALQMICRRYPGSHMAKIAQSRAVQLPATREELQMQDRAGTVSLPALGDSLDDASLEHRKKLPRPQALEQANSLSRRLHQDPRHTPSRERFARLLAEELDNPDEAINQLTLLLEMDDQPDNKRASWLGLIAAYHLKFRGDPDAARRVLERILVEFPTCVEAMAARRRLELMSRAGRSEAGSAANR